MVAEVEMEAKMAIPIRETKRAPRELLKILRKEPNGISSSHSWTIWPVLGQPSWGHMAALGQRPALAAPLQATPYGRYKEKSVRNWGFHTSACWVVDDTLCCIN